ncbi:MAG: orotidine-5'-phosphate decarboxylase [Muribaculaceae bacterium]|nr:orotidine-5'-phosphate decarboxylase [Muribaculaceae bacterium]
MTRKKLVEEINKKGSFLCVGLDPDLKKLPEHLKEVENPIWEFNKAIIDATAPYAVAFKPNWAFYECYGIKGVEALEKTVSYIKSQYPEIMVIADAKRGDIGNTAAMYAKAVFENMSCDAVTLAPYMGRDSVQPFMDYEGHWCIVLALTSNKSASDFETLELAGGDRMYEQVLEVSSKWGTDENTMYVVGATQAESLDRVREIVPTHFLLVPGVGAQGGSLEEVARYGMTEDCGLLVNSSRGIIYASSGTDFAEAAAREAEKLAKAMAELLQACR